MTTLSPSIAVLTIGDELINGEMADTNTRTIARLLGGAGLKIREALSVGDDEDDIARALQQLQERRRVVIVTGGLGPTGDDLTARGAARAFRRPLCLNDEALAQIRAHFRRTGRDMHPRNEKQALLPQRATVIPNPIGSAPGFALQVEHCTLFFLPGVPNEMEAMLRASLLPQLAGLVPVTVFRERIYTLLGIAEPAVDARLEAIAFPEGVTIGYGVDFPLVYLKLRACGPDADALLDQAEVLALRSVGDYFVARDAESPAQAVARLLTAAGESLALAESCTGGLIAGQLTAIPGASAFFERGAVTYANSAKTSWLKVPAWMIERDGAVSESTARLMARGVRRAAGTDYGLAVTGIAGPTGGSAEKPVGTVYIAVAAADGERVELFRFGGSRDEIRLLAAAHALDLLRRRILDL